MKMLTWNIQAGIGTQRYRDYLLRAHRQLVHTSAKVEILQAIAKEVAKYDVVCLQEVDLGGRRSGFRCQANDIATLSDHPYVEVQENRTILGVSRHGNAILSRWPMRNVRDLKLPGRLAGRGCLIAVVDGPLSVTVASLHLSLGVSDQTRQLTFIAEALQGQGVWTAMGDYNCRANSAPIHSFCEVSGGKHTRVSHATFPSWKPRWDYDHIIASEGLSVSHYDRLPVVHSDHLPVAAKLEF